MPGDVVHGWRVLGLDGFKTPGEIVLYDRARRTAIVGDALWGTPAGALTLMPDAKLADPARAALSARALRAHTIDHLLVGDGACVFGSAQVAIGAMLDARAGVAINRINVLDELQLHRDEAPAPFSAEWSEVGRYIGAERLGYGVMRLSRGESFCPYHWHTREEELFVVLAGAPTLRTPTATFDLRAGEFENFSVFDAGGADGFAVAAIQAAGDCVAFVTGERGSHRIWNDGDDPAIVLAIANTDAGDACYYPDSRKFVVEATGTLVREVPQLDYFDGETS